jgi:hypothetical protein
MHCHVSFGIVLAGIFVAALQSTLVVHCAFRGLAFSQVPSSINLQLLNIAHPASLRLETK